MVYTGELLTRALLTVSHWVYHDNQQHKSLADNTFFSNEYDYIVVGAGAAGSVAANRLSELRGVRTLLLELGGQETVATDIPAMDLLNCLPPTNMTQAILIEPQDQACRGFNNNQVTWLVHNALGGGTTLNGMFYNRGGPKDYDGWEKDYGAKGWSYREVLKYFKKSEDNTDASLTKGSIYHKTGGLLTVVSPDITQASENYQKLTKVFVSGANEIGYKTTDINGKDQVGVGIPQRTIRNGKRLSTAGAFLEPAKHRDNLDILTQAQVTRLLFEDPDSPKQVTGVEFIYKGETRTVNVRKEVILSAGVVGSPKILLLSGIGPQDQLKNLNIPVIADLPVGENLHDHTRVGGVDFTVNTTLFTFWDSLLTLQNLDLYYNNQSGPLTSTFYDQQAGLINIRTKVPDRGLTFGPSDVYIKPYLIPPASNGLVIIGPDFKKQVLDGYYKPNADKNTLNLIITLNYVKSRGWIRLKSSDPQDTPIINPGYLTNRDDVDRLIEAFKIAASLESSKAFQSIGAKMYEQKVPGCEQFALKTDPYIECVVRTLTASELHFAGSCKMAGASDPTAVVDPRLRVLGGIKGVRVADASIMPSAATGNLMAPTIMIGERAADFIKHDKNDWGKNCRFY